MAFVISTDIIAGPSIVFATSTSTSGSCCRIPSDIAIVITVVIAIIYTHRLKGLEKARDRLRSFRVVACVMAQLTQHGAH